MFILYAEKTKLSIQKSEPVTSGSVNVYPVRFQFSPDWDGMVPTAVFRADWKSYSVVLDESGGCVIPWEALTKPRVKLEVGVYGTRDGDVVLPTVWTDLVTILEGAGPGEAARPPTAGLYEQVMSELADMRERVGALTAPDHRQLTGRGAADQHPIQAVTGLEDALSHIPEPMTAQRLEDILKGEDAPRPSGAEVFLGDAGTAALWERIKAELDAKQDRGEQDAATDEEVGEMLEEVFGAPGGTSIPERETASTAEIQEMLDEVFGTSRAN